MIKIEFVPESESFTPAASEYADIWNADGSRVVEAIQTVTGLPLEEEVQAVVFEGISRSHPLKFRASYDRETKAATIVHELLHRVCVANHLKLPVDDEDRGIAAHKQIDLALYDIWRSLYGQEFADRQVAIESERANGKYREAWGWALSMSEQERQAKFASLIPKE